MVDMEHVQVTAVHVLGHLRVRLMFSDGLIRDLDLGPLLDAAPAFARHRRDPTFFSRVRCQDGTIAWPDNTSLDSFVLHGGADPAAAPPPRLIGEHRPPVEVTG